MGKISVKECKKLALRLLGEEKAYQVLSQNETVNDDGVKGVLARIHTATEIVASEIFTDYFQAIKKELVQTQNKCVSFDSLSERIVEIKRIERNGGKAKFELFHDKIELDKDGQIEITYVYLPKFDENTTEFDIQCTKITERIIAFGICAEYCLMSDRFSDANSFDSLFKDGLVQAEKSSTPRKIKRRWWL